MKDNKKSKLDEIAISIKKVFGLDKTLLINSSIFNVFESFQDISNIEIRCQTKQSSKKSRNLLEGDPFFLLDNLKEKFDLILGDLPFGLMRESWSDRDKGLNLRERRNWLIIFKTLFLLNENGYGLYLAESIFCSTKSFIQVLNNKGFFINAIFNTPEKIFHPTTSLRPVLILISKRKGDKLFAAELNEATQIEQLIGNLKNKIHSGNLEDGIFVNSEEFSDFTKYKISQQVEKLLKQFQVFEKYKIEDIAEDIILGPNLNDKENSIYIQKIGNSPVILDLKEGKLKHQNYIQIILDQEKVKAEYLVLFFKSEIGKIILQMLFSGTIIQHISKKEIKKCEIPIPLIETQREIITTHDKFNLLKKRMNEFEKKISLNPLSSIKIQESLYNLLDSIDMLNETDKILSVIRKGESKTIEFKQTLSKNIHTNKKDRNIEHAVLKTIAAFLNSEGGVLLVGVRDSGDITGIEADLFKSNDDYLKHLHNLIRDCIGEQFYPLIDYKIMEINSRKILSINCKKSNQPVYLGKEEEFFVRTNPATDKLTGRKLVEYIQNHFEK